MKRFLLYLVVLVLPLLSGCSSHPQTVTFDHVTYHYQSSQDAAVIYRSDTGQTLSVEANAEGTRVVADGQVYLVTGTAQDFQVVFPRGVQLSRHYDANSSYGGASPGVEVSMEDWDRVDELRSLVFHPETDRSSAGVWRYPLGLLLIAAGILQVVNPRVAWQISEGWRYANVEPSDLYLTLSRVGGVVFILAGLFVLLGSI